MLGFKEIDTTSRAQDDSKRIQSCATRFPRENDGGNAAVPSTILSSAAVAAAAVAVAREWRDTAVQSDRRRAAKRRIQPSRSQR